ncbi:MAG: hypothetical protein HYU67_09870 [Flavobacteriia bacterium]|nr:hypothetical protein [Flavobacteriia bacterium]
MKKSLLALYLVLSTCYYSQNYDQAFGIKSGYPGYGALNFKSFFSPNNSFDLLFGASFEDLNRYIWLNCLFETNRNIVNTSGFSWYAGIGPAVGYWMKGNSGPKGKYDELDPTTIKTYKSWVGINTALGIEYTLSGLPLNFGLEAGPAVNFYIGNSFFVEPTGLVNVAVRYVVN